MSNSSVDYSDKTVTPIAAVLEVLESKLLEDGKSYKRLLQEYAETENKQVQAQILRQLQLHGDKNILKGVQLPKMLQNFYKAQLITLGELSPEIQDLLTREIKSYLKNTDVQNIINYINTDSTAKHQITRYLIEVFSETHQKEMTPFYGDMMRTV